MIFVADAIAILKKRLEKPKLCSFFRDVHTFRVIYYSRIVNFERFLNSKNKFLAFWPTFWNTELERICSTIEWIQSNIAAVQDDNRIR